jgi:NitT/TauT family transport system substrate-binding protein
LAQAATAAKGLFSVVRAAVAACAMLLVTLAAGGCAAPPRDALRIGMNVWPPYELLYLARERGYFRDEGVEVDLVDFSSYSGELAAYHQGQIDALLATLNEVQIRDNFQEPPMVVLALDYSFGGDAVVARRGIDAPAALRGRVVAYEESALGSYVLERALAHGGLLQRDVTLKNRLPEESEADFRKGKVDAVVTYEPFLGRLLEVPGARVVFSSREIPGEIVDVLAARPAVLETRRDDFRRVARAWFRALDEFRARPVESAAIMARHENISAEELLRALSGSHLPDRVENLRLVGTSMTPGSLSATADRLGEFLVRHGLARRPATGPEVLSAAALEPR